jgi:hypothetical protein
MAAASRTHDGAHPAWAAAAGVVGIRGPIPWPCYDEETVALYKAGLLSDEEIADLMPEWRRHYERSFDEHFSYT